jgi:hypothetical protein
MASEAASGIVLSYAGAWDARDEGERRALLERIVGFFGPLPRG